MNDLDFEAMADEADRGVDVKTLKKVTDPNMILEFRIAGLEHKLELIKKQLSQNKQDAQLVA